MNDLIVGIRDYLRRPSPLISTAIIDPLKIRVISDPNKKFNYAISYPWIGIQMVDFTSMPKVEKGKPFGVIQYNVNIWYFDQNATDDESAIIGDATRPGTLNTVRLIADIMDSVANPKVMENIQMDFPIMTSTGFNNAGGEIRVVGIVGPVPFNPTNYQQGVNMDLITTKTQIRLWIMRQEGRKYAAA